MRFVRGDGVWHLVTGSEGGNGRIIATLQSDVEVLALKRFCELYLASPETLPSRFEIEHLGQTYKVYFLGGSGEKLTLHIDRGDGETLSVHTDFML